MIVAGIGCRAGVDAATAREAIAAALRETGRGVAEIALLATLPAKAEEPGLIAAAAALGLELLAVPEDALRAVAPRCLTDSPRVRRVTGLPSVAEAAAVAAAGPGARLLAPRSAAGGATCALAESAA